MGVFLEKKKKKPVTRIRPMSIIQFHSDEESEGDDKGALRDVITREVVSRKESIPKEEQDTKDLDAIHDKKENDDEIEEISTKNETKDEEEPESDIEVSPENK